jgi:hypothetical protein
LLLPAAAGCWTRRIGPAMALGLVAGYAGLLLSYFLNHPLGRPSSWWGGGFYLLSLSSTSYVPRRNVLAREHA